MTLLAPMASILAGAFAFPLLFMFYMLKLRRRPLTVSASFLWEQANSDVQGNIPLRWIPPSLLFLLHALILALLVLALGRPAIQASGPSSAQAYFLVDLSASMGATDGTDGKTRLQMATQKALDLGRGMLNSPGRPVITVIAFANDARIASRQIDSIRQLRAVLRSLETTDQPGKLEPALRLAESMIQAPADESTAPEMPEVVVFSDGWFMDQTPLALRGARVSLANVSPTGGSETGNIGIVAFSAARDENNPANALLFFRLQSTFREDRPATLTLFVDSEQTRTYSIIVPGGTPESPGSIGRSVPVQTPNSAVITAVLADEDLLVADNSARVFLPAHRRARVLLVHPDDSEPNLFLRGVLEEIPLRSLRVLSRSEYDQFTLEQIGNAIDLVVFDRVAPEEFPVLPTLSFGSWGGAIETDHESAGATGFILTWDRGSEYLAHVSLDTVQIAQGIPSATPASLEAFGSAKELATTRQGPAMILVENSAGPHLFVTFALEDSNWPLHFSFPIFMLNAVETLTGSSTTRASIAFTTAEPAIVRLLKPRDRLVLTGPEPVTIERTTNTTGMISLGILPRSGLYRNADIEPPAVAVNLLAPEESTLRVREDLVVGGVDTPQVESIQGVREIWPWFLYATVFLLVIEWFVYARRVRV